MTLEKQNADSYAVGHLAGARAIKRTLSEPARLAQIRAWLADGSIADRMALADRACEAFGLFDARGRLRRSERLKALRSLEVSGDLMFPPPRRGVGGRRPHRLGEAVVDPVDVPAAVHDLQGLKLIRVMDADRRERELARVVGLSRLLIRP